MKVLEKDICQELSWWISNQEYWTLWKVDLLEGYLDLITSFMENMVLVTIGQKVITLMDSNSSIKSAILSEDKPNNVTVYKDSKSLTHWVAEQVQEWEPSSSQSLEKNIPTE